jgi:hypothetical protein
MLGSLAQKGDDQKTIATGPIADIYIYTVDPTVSVHQNTAQSQTSHLIYPLKYEQFPIAMRKIYKVGFSAINALWHEGGLLRVASRNSLFEKA